MTSTVTRRVLTALLATLALLAGGLAQATAASASVSKYARYNTGYPNTYARINAYDNNSIHLNGTKLFSVSCSYGCDRGWGEMVMNSGDNFKLYVDGGKSDSHKFYSGVAKFRFCVVNRSCTAWKTNANADS